MFLKGLPQIGFVSRNANKQCVANLRLLAVCDFFAQISQPYCSNCRTAGPLERTVFKRTTPGATSRERCLTVPLSTTKSIAALGVFLTTSRTSRPDTRQHLTTCSPKKRICLHLPGRPHTSAADRLTRLHFREANFFAYCSMRKGKAESDLALKGKSRWSRAIIAAAFACCMSLRRCPGLRPCASVETQYL